MQIVEESGSRITRRRLLEARAARRRAARSALALLDAGRLARARCSTSARFYATPWRRGRRLVDEHGRPLPRRRHRGGRLLHRVPGGRGQGGARRVRSSSCGCRRGELDLPAELAGLRRRRDRRLLEDLHARRLRDLALPRAALPARPSRSRRSSARATTRRSTRRPAARCSSGPAGRKLPMLPLDVDRDGGFLRAAGNFDGPVGPSWWGVRLTEAERRDPRGRPLRRPAHGHRAVPAQDAALPLPRPLVVPARRGRALRVHRARRDRHLPDVLLRRQHARRSSTTARTRRCRGST